MKKLGIIVMILVMAFTFFGCQKDSGERELTLKEDTLSAQYIYNNDGTGIIQVQIAYDNPQEEGDATVEFLVVAQTKNGKYSDIKVINESSNYKEETLAVVVLDKPEVVTVQVTLDGTVDDIFNIEADKEDANLLTMKLV